MKKIIILLLCCGVLIGMVGCGGNTAPLTTKNPPTMVSKTTITETPFETAPPTTAIEPTEEEKEPVPTESADQTTKPTVTATEPTTTAKKKLKLQTGCMMMLIHLQRHRFFCIGLIISIP